MSYANPDGIDAALDYYAAADRIDVCTNEPTTFTEATSTFTVGNYALTPGDGNGDFTIADGDTSGRKLIMGQQSGNNGTGTGNANWFAFTVGSDLLLVVPANGVQVNSGAAFSIAQLDNLYEIREPS